ncbi:unnamed protein product, partial [Meganyctiphanes norvegica]
MFSSGVGGGGSGGSSGSGSRSGIGSGIGNGGFVSGISCSGPVSWLCQEALRCTSKVAPNVSGDMAECDQCAAKFTLLKRKRTCGMCTLLFCSNCVTRIPGGSRQCHKCQVLSQWPVDAAQLAALRVKDLRHFLHSNNINTVNCTEKRELIDLVTVQLHNQHRRYNSSSKHQHHRAPSSSQHRQPPHVTNTTVRDDGIRVRPTSIHVEDPHNSGSIRVRSGPPASPGSSNYDPETDPGIRVFSSESINTQVLGSDEGVGGGSPATESEGQMSCGHCHSNGDCSASCSSLDDSWAVVHNPEREPMYSWIKFDGSCSKNGITIGAGIPSPSVAKPWPTSHQRTRVSSLLGSTQAPSSDESPIADNVSTLLDPGSNLPSTASPSSPILSVPTSTDTSSPIPSADTDNRQGSDPTPGSPSLDKIIEKRRQRSISEKQAYEARRERASPSTSHNVESDVESDVVSSDDRSSFNHVGNDTARVAVILTDTDVEEVLLSIIAIEVLKGVLIWQRRVSPGRPYPRHDFFSSDVLRVWDYGIMTHDVDVLKEYNICSSSIAAIVFDTTAVNSGHRQGIVVRLEAEFGRPLLQLPCRHHILELV